MTEWCHRHPPEFHAIGLKLCEKLPDYIAGCNFHFNANDCEIIVYDSPNTIISIIDLDDEIEVWTIGTAAAIIGKVDYANPDFIREVANMLSKFRTIKFHGMIRNLIFFS